MTTMANNKNFLCCYLSPVMCKLPYSCLCVSFLYRKAVDNIWQVGQEWEPKLSDLWRSHFPAEPEVQSESLIRLSSFVNTPLLSRRVTLIYTHSRISSPPPSLSSNCCYCSLSWALWVTHVKDSWILLRVLSKPTPVTPITSTHKIQTQKVQMWTTQRNKAAKLKSGSCKVEFRSHFRCIKTSETWMKNSEEASTYR
jgi:hypothetical protein